MILALDLSTKPGYALLDGKGGRFASGTSMPRRRLKDLPVSYPYNYVVMAEEVVELLINRIGYHLKGDLSKITKVVIEETTGSSQNYSQKILEFIHLEFLKKSSVLLKGVEVVYIRDGVWKDFMGAFMNKEEKKNNQKFSRLRAAKKKKNPKLKRIVINKDNKGNPIKKITPQDAYVRCANDHFNLKLKIEDEDQAAALLVGAAYLRGAPICDGTLKGGLR